MHADLLENKKEITELYEQNKDNFEVAKYYVKTIIA